MTASDSAALVDLIGFITGALLYGMLLAMVLRWPLARPVGERPRVRAADRLALVTALLGLVWNAGSLALHRLRGFFVEEPTEVLAALTFAALGFLPAVVVHSALPPGAGKRAGARLMVASAYAASAVAAVMHVTSAVTTGAVPSYTGLRLLTGAFVILIAALFVISRGQPGRRRAVSVVALAIFSVTALHLSEHSVGEETWWGELVVHHASLPLALAILYQDYKFALADLFLKRALALIALVAVVSGAYALLAGPLLVRGQGAPSPGVVVTLLALWVGTALLYPWLWSACGRFVDSVVLRRPDYTAVCADVARAVSAQAEPDAMLDEACERLAPALSAREVWWTRFGKYEDGRPSRGARFRPLPAGFDGDALRAQPDSSSWVHLPPFRTAAAAPTPLDTASAAVSIPTVETPTYVLVVSDLAGGRRLLSDDVAMLDTVAVAVARRIDAVRVEGERLAYELRQQETSRLAAEAELRTLRAQINPHFLFNALTTIGYLIQTAPERALDTLMRLTGLLRGVLRSSGEFYAFGQELQLIESYLDIERARFEERLSVVVDVPEPVRAIPIPALLVQPLVENAVKHGVSRRAAGGEVRIVARIEQTDEGRRELYIRVEDTGPGASPVAFEQGRRRGVGLANIERRLAVHYGQDASLDVRSAKGDGTCATLRLPVTARAPDGGSPSQPEAAGVKV